jgi:hypothetical protein
VWAGVAGAGGDCSKLSLLQSFPCLAGVGGAGRPVQLGGVPQGDARRLPRAPRRLPRLRNEPAPPGKRSRRSAADLGPPTAREGRD